MRATDSDRSCSVRMWSPEGKERSRNENLSAHAAPGRRERLYGESVCTKPQGVRPQADTAPQLIAPGESWPGDPARLGSHTGVSRPGPCLQCGWGASGVHEGWGRPGVCLPKRQHHRQTGTWCVERGAQRGSHNHSDGLVPDSNAGTGRRAGP